MAVAELSWIRYSLFQTDTVITDQNHTRLPRLAELVKSSAVFSLSFVSGMTFPAVLSWVAHFPWLFTFLAISVLGALVLILAFRCDERLDRTIDSGYHWQYPEIDIAASIVKLTAILIWNSAFLCIVILVIWRDIAYKVGGQPVPVPYVDLSLSDTVQSVAVLQVMIGCVVLIFAIYAVRCGRSALYDIFISYKSEDVALARRIADVLIAAGLRIWFAEYEILLHERDRFQRAILRGISETRFGLALTNNRWAQSEYCDFEIKRLLKVLKPASVLELRCPSEELPHGINPGLIESPSAESRDVTEILTFVERVTGLQISQSPVISSPKSGRRFNAKAAGRPCSLLIEGWTPTESVRSDGSLKDQKFRCDAVKDALLYVHIDLPGGSIVGPRSAQSIDDRKMFDDLVAWVPRHLHMLQTDFSVRVKVRSVHLLFHSGLSQFAVTYWVRLNWRHGYWTRKIAIIIPNQGTGETEEFVFTFGFHGSLADYCRYADLMDSFALSLEWT
jgi:hypothetical protein